LPDTVRLPSAKRPTAVVLFSGGIDSTTLLYDVGITHEPVAISFDYGQRHLRELDAAKRIAAGIPVRRHSIQLGRWAAMNALTGEHIAVPHGHYEADTMRQTVVPNRNAIMLAYAFGIAADIGASIVATAVHAGDHAVYPDCRPEFIEAFQLMEDRALDGVGALAPRLHAPFVNWTKAEIVNYGASLNVPFGDTWSCYEGGSIHCGKCGTCVERKEAFALAKVPDQTAYTDETGVYRG
jgi:7-cyano-7-deazaguanine synthase